MDLSALRSALRMPPIINRIIRNLVFWLLFTWWHFMDRDHIGKFFMPMFVDIILVYGVPAYVNNLWLIPGFLYKRRYILYLILFTALLFITAGISVYTTAILNKLYPGIDFMGNSPKSIFYHAFPCLWVFMMLAFGKYLSDVLANQRKIEELQNQKLASELESLKSQINPHFLFNALNTIYGMARRTNMETADAVMKLSDILRYVLYDCNDDSIKLEKEIEHLQQYIAFVRLRVHNKENIHLNIQGEPNGHTIAPLLLMPFIENAIKHGLGKHSQNSWVDVKLDISETALSFKCANSNYNRHLVSSGNGIGLKNVRRRLELLYPENHHLKITDDPSQYTVQLNIQLS